jgi:YD repeat-containing protein
MRKVCWVLLALAACTSPERKENNGAPVPEQILNEDISTTFRPETFAGDIEHISEVTYTAVTTGDYVRKDTSTREYLFKGKRLYQVATVTRRMRIDTLTIRYDTAGRIAALVYSDDRNTYNTDRFKYDAAGRRIEKVNRFYTTESRSSYQYNKAGDTLLITRQPGNSKELISIRRQADTVLVTRQPLDSSSMAQTVVEKYNKANQLVEVSVYLNGMADYKVIKSYDNHGNLLLWEHRQGNHQQKEGFGEVNKRISYNREYTYDSKGNWISRKEQMQDKGWSAVTTRKISYR